jgi:hypothetical protein
MSGAVLDLLRKSKKKAKKKSKNLECLLSLHIISAYSALFSFVSRRSHKAKGNYCFYLLYLTSLTWSISATSGPR